MMSPILRPNICPTPYLSCSIMHFQIRKCCADGKFWIYSYKGGTNSLLTGGKRSSENFLRIRADYCLKRGERRNSRDLKPLSPWTTSTSNKMRPGTLILNMVGWIGWLQHGSSTSRN